MVSEPPWKKPYHSSLVLRSNLRGKVWSKTQNIPANIEGCLGEYFRSIIADILQEFSSLFGTNTSAYLWYAWQVSEASWRPVLRPGLVQITESFGWVSRWISVRLRSVVGRIFRKTEVYMKLHPSKGLWDFDMSLWCLYTSLKNFFRASSKDDLQHEPQNT